MGSYLPFVLAGLLQWVNTESRVSRRSVLNTKARYAAESAGEFALESIASRLIEVFGQVSERDAN